MMWYPQKHASMLIMLIPLKDMVGYEVINYPTPTALLQYHDFIFGMQNLLTEFTLVRKFMK